MSRAVHPSLTGLHRAGGSARRLAAELEESDARIRTLDVDLDIHPLLASASWEPLVADDEMAERRRASLLARLVRAASERLATTTGRPQENEPQARRSDLQRHTDRTDEVPRSGLQASSDTTGAEDRRRPVDGEIADRTGASRMDERHEIARLLARLARAASEQLATTTGRPQKNEPRARRSDLQRHTDRADEVPRSGLQASPDTAGAEGRRRPVDGEIADRTGTSRMDERHDMQSRDRPRPKVRQSNGARPAPGWDSIAVDGDRTAARKYMERSGTALSEPSGSAEDRVEPKPAHGRWLNDVDPILRDAAARPVGREASEDGARLVGQILAGLDIRPAGDVDPSIPQADLAPPFSVAERTIEMSLSRLRTGAAMRATLPAPLSIDTARPALERRETPPQPVPRSGLERLLARGRRENLVRPNLSAGPQTRLAPDRAPGGAEPTEPVIGLDRSTQPRHRDASSFPPEGDSAADQDAFARALADLLRREARSAGVDLKGGS